MEYGLCQMCDGVVDEKARKYGIHLCPSCSMLEIRSLNEEIKKKEETIRKRNMLVKQLRIKLNHAQLKLKEISPEEWRLEYKKIENA